MEAPHEGKQQRRPTAEEPWYYAHLVYSVVQFSVLIGGGSPWADWWWFVLRILIGVGTMGYIGLGVGSSGSWVTLSGWMMFVKPGQLQAV